MVCLVLSIFGGFGGVFYGGYRPDVATINAAVESELPGFSPTMFGTGGGGYGIINGFLVGGSGFGGMLSSESSTMHGELEYEGGFFEIGYAKPLFKPCSGFLTFGLGGVGMVLRLNRILSDVPFDSLLKDPGRRASLTAEGMCVAMSGGLLFKFVRWITLGIKIGYIFSPERPDWRLDDGHQVLGGPSVNLSSPYVALVFYFGSIMGDGYGR